MYLHAEFLVQQLRRILPRQLQLFLVQVDGQVSQREVGVVSVRRQTIRWTVLVWKCCPGVCLRLALVVLALVLHLIWQRITSSMFCACLLSVAWVSACLGSSSPEWKYCGTFVSTAPVAVPTVMSFTVPWTRSTIVATAAVVTTCSVFHS